MKMSFWGWRRMIKFKSKYKSEYNKILEKCDECQKNEAKSVYDFEKKSSHFVFKRAVANTNKSAYITISDRRRNKREKFENELICVE